MRPSDECYTPNWLVDLAELELDGIDTDPCWAEGSHVRAAWQYDREADGLVRGWVGGVWLNPPYSNVGPWLSKAVRVSSEGCRVVALVKADPSVGWWNRYVWPKADAVGFLRKRVAFDGAYAKGRGANFASAVVGYGCELRAFASVAHVVRL